MKALMQLVGMEQTAERVVALHRTWILLAEDGQPAGGRAIAARTSRWGRWPCRAGHGPKGPAPGQRRRSENSRLRDRRPTMTSIWLAVLPYVGSSRAVGGSPVSWGSAFVGADELRHRQEVARDHPLQLPDAGAGREPELLAKGVEPNR